MAVAPPNYPARTGAAVANGRAFRWACCAAACLAALAGCRSASRTDLVEREMRQQEDQIYAMQDYLAEYEQLLCQYRTENEALKRELVTQQFRDGPPSRRGDGVAPPLRDTPAPLAEPPADVPPPEFEELEIPPLDAASADDSEGVSLAIAEHASHDDMEPLRREGIVTPVAFEEPAPGDALEPATKRVAQVVLRGQVWPKDGETGPRVLVDVDPLTAAGAPIAHQGSLSLMVLDVDSTGTERSLARWDFAAEELEAVSVEGTDGTAFQFPLELPATTPTDGTVQLWCRLLLPGGEKVLAHAELELGRAGEFASEMPKWVTEETIVDEQSQVETGSAVRQASAVAELDSTITLDVPVRQSDWQIARPDDPPVQASASGFSQSDWRLATQPIPPAEERPIYDTVAREAPHAAPTYELLSKPRYDEAPAQKLRMPRWSPERPTTVIESSTSEAPGDRPPGDDVTRLRPAWSPNR